MTMLRAERMRLRLTAGSVAIAAGISASNLSRIELGQQMPKREVARALFLFFGGNVPLGDCYDPLARFELEFTGGGDDVPDRDNAQSADVRAGGTDSAG